MHEYHQLLVSSMSSEGKEKEAAKHAEVAQEVDDSSPHNPHQNNTTNNNNHDNHGDHGGQSLTMTGKEAQIREMKEQLRELKMDGAMNIFGEHRRLQVRIIWLVLILCSGSTCSFLIVKSIGEFFLYDVTTKTRLLTEQYSTNPAIIICNLNPFTTPYADALFVKAGLDNKLDNLPDLEYYMKQTTGAYLSDAQKANMSSLDDILIKCTVAGVTCDSRYFYYFKNERTY